MASCTTEEEHYSSVELKHVLSLKFPHVPQGNVLIDDDDDTDDAADAEDDGNDDDNDGDGTVMMMMMMIKMMMAMMMVMKLSQLLSAHYTTSVSMQEPSLSLSLNLASCSHTYLLERKRRSAGNSSLLLTRTTSPTRTSCQQMVIVLPLRNTGGIWRVQETSYIISVLWNKKSTTGTVR